MEAPVVGVPGRNGKVVGAVLVARHKTRLIVQQVSLRHIGAGKQVARGVHGGDVVHLQEMRVLDKAQAGVLLQQSVKLPAEVAAHQHDVLNARRARRVQQAVDDAPAVDAHQRLGGAERDRAQARAEPSRQHHHAADAVRLQCRQPRVGQSAGTQQSARGQLRRLGCGGRAVGFSPPPAGGAGQTAILSGSYRPVTVRLPARPPGRFARVSARRLARCLSRRWLRRKMRRWLRYPHR